MLKVNNSGVQQASFGNAATNAARKATVQFVKRAQAAEIQAGRFVESFKIHSADEVAKEAGAAVRKAGGNRFNAAEANLVGGFPIDGKMTDNVARIESQGNLFAGADFDNLFAAVDDLGKQTKPDIKNMIQESLKGFEKSGGNPIKEVISENPFLKKVV